MSADTLTPEPAKTERSLSEKHESYKAASDRVFGSLNSDIDHEIEDLLDVYGKDGGVPTDNGRSALLQRKVDFNGKPAQIERISAFNVNYHDQAAAEKGTPTFKNSSVELKTQGQRIVLQLLDGKINWVEFIKPTSDGKGRVGEDKDIVTTEALDSNPNDTRTEMVHRTVIGILEALKETAPEREKIKRENEDRAKRMGAAASYTYISPELPK